VSQFTLYHVLKGNSPDFHNSMPATHSKEFFDKFIEKLKTSYKPELIQGKELESGLFLDLSVRVRQTILIDVPFAIRTPWF